MRAPHGPLLAALAIAGALPLGLGGCSSSPGRTDERTEAEEDRPRPETSEMRWKERENERKQAEKWSKEETKETTEEQP